VPRSKPALPRRQKLRGRTQKLWTQRSAVSTATFFVIAGLSPGLASAAPRSSMSGATPQSQPGVTPTHRLTKPAEPTALHPSAESDSKGTTFHSSAAAGKAAQPTPLVRPHQLSPLETVPIDSSQGHMADPTTLWDGQNYDYTFGTNDINYDECGNSLPNKRFFMPVFKSAATNNTTGSTFGGACFLSDAMPNGPGSWATGNYSGDTWAPGIVQLNGRYVMYYTSQKAGTGQQCVGLAFSNVIGGPYTGGTEWACGPNGRWALDPQPFQSGGNTYVAYRDDAIASGNNTGISIVQVDNNGAAIWSTRKNALLSTDVSWATITNGPDTGKNIVENPAVVHGQGGDAGLFLLFSGNDYRQAAYATGLAACANNPLPASRCKVFPSTDHPYWGYPVAGSHSPIYQLPGNHTGAAAMSVYKAGSGSERADWAWVNTAIQPLGEFRHAMNGGIFESGSGNGSTWNIQ
jgi:arabinan endo-1,5-alpha-L-arabinosidase